MDVLERRHYPHRDISCPRLVEHLARARAPAAQQRSEVAEEAGLEEHVALEMVAGSAVEVDDERLRQLGEQILLAPRSRSERRDLQCVPAQGCDVRGFSSRRGRRHAGARGHDEERAGKQAREPGTAHHSSSACNPSSSWPATSQTVPLDPVPRTLRNEASDTSSSVGTRTIQGAGRAQRGRHSRAGRRHQTRPRRCVPAVCPRHRNPPDTNFGC